MKKLIFHMAKTFVLGVCLGLAGFTAHAQTTASVTYAGNGDADWSVAVQYNNLSGNAFAIDVYDQHGELLYTGRFTDRHFNKTFRLPRPTVSKAVFTIRDARSKQAQSYEVAAKMEEAMVMKQR